MPQWRMIRLIWRKKQTKLEKFTGILEKILLVNIILNILKFLFINLKTIKENRLDFINPNSDAIEATLENVENTFRNGNF